MLKLLLVTFTLIWASLAQNTCNVSSYDAVSTAVSSCTNIVINGFTVPAGKTLDLSKLKTGASVLFQGSIAFAHSNWLGPLVSISGSKVTITGAPNSRFDGLGATYWDGLGDNGVIKPKFIRITTSGQSLLKDITMINCPNQCVSISGASNTVLDNWLIDITAGDSTGAKNTDGFDVSSCTDVTVQNSVVKNQDDCVAVNQGSNLIFHNLTCSGGHGLSLSVGQSSANGTANTVRNVTFSDSVVLNSLNGVHVKTHSDAGTGSVSLITYKNIKLSGITHVGINVQEDYAKGKSTGTPTNNIPITQLNLQNVTGTMSGCTDCTPVSILCGSTGCSNWTWSQVSITNGKKPNSCNFKPIGFTC